MFPSVFNAHVRHCVVTLFITGLVMAGLGGFAQPNTGFESAVGTPANWSDDKGAMAGTTDPWPGSSTDSAVNATNENSLQSLEGNITQLKVTRGRSQIIKFAQPIIRVSLADPAIADIIPLSPEQFMINGLQRGVTSLIVWDENGQEGIFDLHVENDTSELLEAVKSIAPNELIQARVTDDSFVLSGKVSSSVVLEEIQKLAGAYGYRDQNFVDLTETPTPQVILEVKVAEASKTSIKSLRSGFAADGNDADVSRLDVLGTNTDANGNVIPAVIGRLPSPTFTAAGGLDGQWNINTRYIDFMTRWRFLENTGQINVLAEPKLVCTHNRQAEFLAGGEFPFISGVGNNGVPTVDFREYGVRLKFTPRISVQSNRIGLNVEPEVSQLDRTTCVDVGGSQVCGLLTRKTTTTVDLRDGESLMISGILTREEQNSFSQVPFIADVPILGHFFKNAEMDKRDKELIIVVTPRIVRESHYGEILGGE